MKLLYSLLFTIGAIPFNTLASEVTHGPKPEKIASFNAVSAHTIDFGDSSYYLTTSETSGLTLWSQDNQRLQHYSGRYSLSDMVIIGEHLLVSSINTNTSGVHLVLFSTQDAPQTLSIIPAGDADTEAVCLSSEHDYPEVFIVDARGSIVQYALTSVSSGQAKPVRLRTISGAPGIKSCSVAKSTGTLYLADEYAGIWAYPTDIESDERRSLVYHNPQHSIEGVSALADGTVWWVSPDDAAVYYHSGETVSRHPLPEGSEPEALHASYARKKLTLSVYDDALERVSVYSLANSGSQIMLPEIEHTDFTVKAEAETSPVKRFGDAADDPAIWYNIKAPEQSLILGTDKKAGLNVYSLDGTLKQSLPAGRVNNVDVRYDNGHYFDAADIAVASNRSDNSITVFSVAHQNGYIREVARINTTLNDVYGLCLYQNQNTVDVFINSTDGLYQRHRLHKGKDGITGTLIEEFRLPSQPEGCVADDDRHILYMGEESAGIWRKDLARENSEAIRVADVTAPVQADIEGMAIFDVDNTRYLLVSSQGNHRYALYETDDDHSLAGTFDIGINWEKGIDGVSETDGLDASNLNFGEGFPEGIMVVQDGHNVMPTENQNFKIVDARELAKNIRALIE